MPVYAPHYPVESYQPAAFAPAASWQPQPRQTPPSRPVAATVPAPIIRLQSADEPTPPAPRAPAAQRLQLPSPEQLGVAAAAAKDDWARIHERLEQLGVVCFHVDKLATGNYRVSCLLPTSDPDRSRHIEAQAPDKVEAVRLALGKAEEVSGRKERTP